MTLALFTIGLISLLGQVVILRELNVAFYGVELIYIFSLGIWLFGTALGALIGRRSSAPRPAAVGNLFVVFGLVLPLDLIFIRTSRLLFSGVPGAYLPLHVQFAVAVVSLLPAGLILGLLFQWAAKLSIRKGTTLPHAYAVESAGAVLGGIIAALSLEWGLQGIALALCCAISACIWPAFEFTEGRRRLFHAAVLFGIAVFALLLWKSHLIDERLTSWTHSDLMKSADTPYGRITVEGRGGQVSVFENDALSFETEGTEAELFSHLTALQHPQPRDILLLGGGIEGLIKELQKHAPALIDYVEINPAMLRIVVPHLPPDIRESLRQSNVHITYADPRHYLAGCSQYDLILVGMPEPDSGQANRFYTKEFFTQCSRRLKPGGILAFRLRGGENYWTVPMERRAVSIYRALASVFPETLFLPSSTNIVTASRGPLPQSPDALGERRQARRLETRLVTLPYIRYLFENDRFLKIRALLKSEEAPMNTDVKPACYRYSAMIWLSKFSPRITSWVPLSERTQAAGAAMLPWAIGAGLALIFILLRLNPTLRRVVLVATAALAGMTAETVLILAYQVKSGVLFRDIGLLLTSFMAGLAMGSFFIDRMAKRRGPSRWWGMTMMTGFPLLGLLMMGLFFVEGPPGLLQTAGLLAAAGFLVAGVFSYASLYATRDQAAVVSPLYAADLIGGCAGSLLCSLILIPFAGLDVTTEWMIVVSLLSLLLV